MRGYQIRLDWPGTIRVELSPGNFIKAIPEIIFGVENIGMFLQVQLLNAKGMQPLEFFGTDKWLVNHSWVHQNLVHPGLQEYSHFEVEGMIRRASGQ